jgi:CHAT domain/Bacterial Ig-like domain (group 2)
LAGMVYLDLDLLIQRAGEGYRAQVLSSPAGQAAANFTLPFSAIEIENLLLRAGRARRATRRIDSPEVAAAKNFGERLFAAAFDDDVRACLRSSLDEARRQGNGLRIRLHLAEAPELASLPWEYLYNPTLNRFFALSVETPIVRYLELPEVIRPLMITPPLRVLVMISSPDDYPRLDVEAEWNRLRDALKDLEQRGVVVLERLDQATLSTLQRRLRRGEYHIFHFIGHGGFEQQAQDGVLVMEDDRGRGHSVSGQQLGMLLHDHRAMRLAVLNACEGARASSTDPFSGTAQSLVQQGIPAVIAMQFEITDQAAIVFAHEIYGALADGYPVDAALSEARKAIFAEGNGLEWGTPVLYLRASDGLIFQVARTDVLPADSDRRVPEPEPVAELKKETRSTEEKNAASIPVKEQTSQEQPATRWKIGAAGLLLAALVIGAITWSMKKDEVTQPPVPAAPHLVALTVNMERNELKVKEVVRLKVKGSYSDGKEQEITEGIQWQSTDPLVATVDSQGRLEARQAGEAEITAQFKGIASSASRLTVQATEPSKAAPPLIARGTEPPKAAPPLTARATEPPKAVPSPVRLVSLTVSADKREMKVKELMALRLDGTYSDGKSRALFASIEWQSSDRTVASVNSKGEVEALREGHAEITAEAGGVMSAPLSLVIRAPVKKPEPERPPDGKIQAHINAARAYRDQGNYAFALAELEKAQAIDLTSKEVRAEMELTRKACNAEKRLGRAGLQC